MAPLMFAENASFGFFFSGAGNFIIDTFLEAVETVIIECLCHFLNVFFLFFRHLFNVSSCTRSSYSRILSSSSAMSEI